jgi:hypothetical protein
MLLPVCPGVTVRLHPDCWLMLLGAEVEASKSSAAPPGIAVEVLLTIRISGLIG